MTRPVIGLNMNIRTFDGNLVYSFYPEYANAIIEAGGLPLPVPCSSRTDILETYLAQMDGFLFTGGKDYPPDLFDELPHPQIKLIHPDRVLSDLQLTRLVLASNMPVFGICAGCQLLNIVTGGKIIQHLDTAASHTDGHYHQVMVEDGTILSRIFGSGPLRVNSFHHQAIDQADIGNIFRVSAVAKDGTVEVIESTDDRFIIGVQWHPERMDDGNHRETLFAAFVDACR